MTTFTFMFGGTQRTIEVTNQHMVDAVAWARGVYNDHSVDAEHIDTDEAYLGFVFAGFGPDLDLQWMANKAMRSWAILKGTSPDLLPPDPEAPITPSEPAPPLPGVVINDVAGLLAYAAAKRYQIEISGVLVGGILVPTDREGRSALKHARDLLRDGELLDEAGNVCTTMDITIQSVAVKGVTEQMATAMLEVVGQKVQAAFSREADLIEKIRAVPPTVTSVSQINDPTLVGLSAWPN